MLCRPGRVPCSYRIIVLLVLVAIGLVLVCSSCCWAIGLVFRSCCV